MRLEGNVDSGVAVYDLAVMPTTYDMAAFCVIAKTLGARKVHFRVDGEGGISEKKYPRDYAWRRWANICVPMCRLGGLEWTLGEMDDPMSEGFTHWYHMGVVDELHGVVTARGGRLSLLRDVVGAAGSPEAVGRYVTVTLRDSIRNKWRDSDLPAWKRFVEYLEGRGHEVRIFGDCEFAPMSLEYRMNVYANAEMNFGVNNGPMCLCVYSEVPYIMSNMIPRHNPENAAERLKKYMANGGFPYGSQPGWATADQRIVWEYDTFENLRASYERWRDERRSGGIAGSGPGDSRPVAGLAAAG